MEYEQQQRIGLAKDQDEFDSRTQHYEGLIKAHWSLFVNITAKYECKLNVQ